MEKKLPIFLGAIIVVYLLIVMAPLFFAIAIIGVIAFLFILTFLYLENAWRWFKRFVTKLRNR